MRKFRAGGAVGFHADGVDDGIGAAAAGHLPDHVAEFALGVGQVDRLDVPRLRAGETLGHEIHADDTKTLVRSDAAAMSPIGPSPRTTTEPPSGMSAYSTACHAVGSTSERYTKRESGGPSGTVMCVFFTCGTRRYSAWPPGTPPYSFEYPNSAAPIPSSRIV